ncbi:MAG TPA: alcohol dehydrogenase catalytic domain-containing protein [Syntrophorhabdaceae bacterium]|nr:alcohol dehydrogenase catalytic domain-containing protein [Syntrophorhabdaceae bacterium]MDI9559899.1 alcohol dehydrogenase catalytic domain-containing protein [Pseudomonadota bacterium]HOS59523.1 alcohol dehydrogenase catalytic domain-containing protein [Syntrophorhabdaceae bacterium]HQG50504.1 alcohol dehydrogenase catalytic domain-containing protein [Syntrophorhabdaceae bacterium]HQJ94262.1 alcohol dehydrogenase catalytic domain-containing protein [Syntrophorhabdaceae bacterium]
MRVGMYYNNSKVEVEQLPVPAVGENDILIKVMASGICGSDVLEWYRIKKAPLVLGHEVSGQVIEVGKNVNKFKNGDRVFTTHHVPCDECYWCLTGHQTACITFQSKNNFNPGGFSEYLRITGKSIDTGTFILPDTMSYEQGSFIEPLGTVVRGLRAIDIKPGDTLLILGCGIAGLLMIKLARALGTGRIIATDIYDSRLKAAKRCGAEAIIHAEGNVSEFVKDINNGRLADKVIVCTGSQPAAYQSLESVDRGGTVLLFAVPNPGQTISIDFNPFWRNDISLKTCYGAAPIDNMQAMELIRAKNVIVDDLITHRFGLEDISDGFRVASEAKDCLKIIIKPHGNATNC